MANDNFDLLVLGGGMAGTAGTIRAIQAGGKVCLVEKADALGGSATYAEFIWTAPDLETFREKNPNGDPELAKAFISRFELAVQWVRDLGVEVREPVELLNFGRGYGTDLANLFLIGKRTVEGAEDSELLFESEPVKLLTDGDGSVVGAEVKLASGETREIHAANTLLAMGGFANNQKLRRKHFGELAGELPLRANPHSAGRGLEMATEVGAQFGKENAAFYGHLWASGMTVTDPFQFAPVTFYHSEHGILLNLGGERFMDETVGDQLNAIGLFDQPEGRCLLIYDEFVHREWMMKPYVKGVEPIDKFQAAYKAGARVAIAYETEEFKVLPEEWGYPGEKVYEALTAFNEVGESGPHEPPRTIDSRPLTEPPYYVVEVIPAITFSFGGILIDPRSRALDAAGKPIPGLFAAGGDAGGLYYRAYAGGLAPALVFGLGAADSALS